MYSVWKQSIHCTINPNLHLWINMILLCSFHQTLFPKNIKSFHPRKSLWQLLVYVTCQSSQDNLNTSGWFLGSSFPSSLTVIWEEVKIQSTYLCSWLYLNCRGQTGRSVQQALCLVPLVVSPFQCWDGKLRVCKSFFSLPYPPASNPLQQRVRNLTLMIQLHLSVPQFPLFKLLFQEL